MPRYRLVGHDASGRLNAGCDFAFRDDAEAFAYATSLVTGDYRIEVWNDYRFVARASIRRPLGAVAQMSQSKAQPQLDADPIN